MSTCSDDEILGDNSDIESFDDIDMNDSDIESDDNFDALPISGKSKSRPYEVEHKAISVQDIREAQESQAEQVSHVLAQNTEQALVLLRHYKWNKEKLIDKLMDSPESVLKAAGVSHSSQNPHVTTMSAFSCQICCNESSLYTFAMDCDHRFCKDCYEHYIVDKIVDEGEVRRLTCPGERCNIILTERVIELLTNKEVVDRYKMLADRAYVDDHDNIRWCPHPECDSAVECNISNKQLMQVIPSVFCGNKHNFCFGCGLDNHQPCICSLVKIWVKKCEDDSETSNWISANTKECPKCQSTIEKNGGCNHMTCRKCKYEFCWVCMGVWSDHGQSWYNCNRYDEKSSAVARDNQAKSRASLERYLHYYNRFSNHENSARLDRELYLRTEKKMAQLQVTSDMSWIEVQFLRNAIDTLSECRATLKWTYAFAFYLRRNNATEMFEDNQKDLEMSVEQLSELCERPVVVEQIARLKQSVLDRTVYVASRREVLLSDTCRGLAEGRWEFNSVAADTRQDAGQ